MGELLNMGFDPRKFSSMLATDTCAVWNILSSQKLFYAARCSNLTFCVTPMVVYECLKKPRKFIAPEKEELIRRLHDARKNNCFPQQECQLESLLYVSSIAPKKLNSGELSSIALAYEIQTISFMTDEYAARRFVENDLRLHVETTPKLYGWLHYHCKLSDTDHHHIVHEHENYETRPLTKYLNEAYNEALVCRCADNQAKRLQP